MNGKLQITQTYIYNIDVSVQEKVGGKGLTKHLDIQRSERRFCVCMKSELTAGGGRVGLLQRSVLV